MLKLYMKLPLFIQDFAVTLYYWKSNFEKFGYIPFINNFNRLQKKSQSVDLYSDIDFNLSEIVKHAQKNISYYSDKEEYKKVVTLRTIMNIPIIPKMVVKKSSELFLAKSCGKSRSFKTSGSTGMPMSGKVGITYLRHRFMVYLNLLSSMGVDFNEPYGRFLGKELISSAVRVYRRDLINNHFLFSVYHLDNLNISKYYQALVNNKIEVLEGYPSVIFSLVQLCKNNNLPKIKLKVVIVTAEKLHLHQKEQIEDFFDCIVFDYYGSNEASPFIYFDFASNSYLTVPSTGVVEVLNEAGEWVNPGEEGNMVVTNYNPCMPLIRYKIGDRCILHENQNDLQKGEIRIQEILGRDDEVIELKNGKRFSRFSLLLKYLPDFVDASQLIINVQKGTIIVNFISSQELIPPYDIDVFRNEFYRLISEDFQVEGVKVKQLVKNKSGKVKTIIIEKD